MVRFGSVQLGKVSNYLMLIRRTDVVGEPTFGELTVGEQSQ